MRIVLFLSISLLAPPVFGDDPAVTLKGILLERGTRAPLGGVNVFVLPSKAKATTDAEGRFSVEGVPAGELTWVVNYSGFEKLEQADFQGAGTPNEERRLLLRKLTYDIYETTIYGKEEKRDDRDKSLNASEFLKLPGSGGDPIKAVQNFPGVARPQGFSSQVSIEGSAPQDTLYHFDGHQIPLIFHFGGLTSVIFPEALERIDFKASGYGPEFGRALGGHVGAWSRAGRTDRFHGLAYVDIFQAGLLVDTPVGSGSLLLGGRHSYIGQVLRLAFAGNKDFDLTVAPGFSDVVGVYHLPLGGGSRFRLSTLGSLDTLEFVFNNPVGKDAAKRGSFSNRTSFYRLIPQLIVKHDEELTSRWSLSLGRDFFRINVFDDFFDLSSYTFGARTEADYQVSSSWRSQLGLDSNFTWTQYSYKLPDAQFGSSSTTSGSLRSQETPQFSEVGLYWRNPIEPEDSAWTLTPGARLDYFNVTKEVVPQPRLAVRYDIDEYFNLRAAGGLYAQAPQGQEVDPILGNPDIKSPRALHLTVGAEKDFREGSSEGWLGSSDIFYKSLRQLVVSSTRTVTRNGQLTPERYTNEGEGHAFGLVSSVKLFHKPFTATFAYTLSRSRRRDPDHGDYSFRYDQTHLLTVLGTANMENDWSFGARLRYVTGNPTTPVLGGIFDSDDDTFRPLRGPYFSERLGDFFSLDIRIDKKWVYDDWILSAYLDIQNVTNQQNAEAVRYTYDYSRSENVTGLPFLPTFGVKGEF